jgi:hypothetical protein
VPAQAMIAAVNPRRDSLMILHLHSHASFDLLIVMMFLARVALP